MSANPLACVANIVLMSEAPSVVTAKRDTHSKGMGAPAKSQVCNSSGQKMTDIFLLYPQSTDVEALGFRLILGRTRIDGMEP